MSGYVTADTAGGTVRGVEAAGVRAFLGIRYGTAARFEPPRPEQPWTGLREAMAFGPAAPQVDTRLFSGERMQHLLTLMYPRAGTPVEGGPMSEDCLHLNVWAPAHGQPRPVMVWFHGGAFLHGTGAEMMFNGDRLAATQDVVVVTVNHRLGLFGHLAANAGILDLELALRWVGDNIAAFGGDPGNVTIFGQSGGAAKVATLMAMPRVQGLFHKAIMQSGPMRRVGTTDDRDKLLHNLNLPLDRLRELTTAELLAVQTKALYGEQPSGGGDPFESGWLGVGPVLDGENIPVHPFDPAPPDWVADVPLMIGSTTHDAALLLIDHPGYAETTDEDLPPEHRQAHPKESAPLLRARMVSDAIFGDGSRLLAERKRTQPAPVYTYEFAHPTPVMNGLLGACHSLELAYVFNVVDRIPLTGNDPDRHRVAEETSRAWAAFARSGDPGWTDHKIID